MADPMADEVILTIDGRRHRGWTNVSIRRSLDSLTGSFQLALTSRETSYGAARTIRALAPCALSIDGERVMSGTIDQLSIELGSQDHSLTVTGRDAAADLVDCAAIASPGSWRHAKFELIVGDLLAPFGIKARFNAATGAAIKRFALQQGETVQAAIERLCRFRAFVAWSEPDGSIVIGNPGSAQSAGRLVEGEHMLELAIDHDVSERFSKYIVKGQSSGDDEAHGRAVSQLRAEASDPAITRYRPLIIIAEEQSDTAALKKRATWEANVRAARGQTCRLTVPGWRDPAGALWEPATRVQVVAPSLAIDVEMIVISAELERGDAGTLARLELQRPEAWSQLPVPENAEASSLRRAA